MDQSVPPSQPPPAGPPAGAAPPGPPPSGPPMPGPPPVPPSAAPSWVTQAPPPAAQPAVMWATPTEPVGPAPGIAFAPHGARLVAYIIDSIIVTFIIGIFVFIASALLLSGATIQGDQVSSVSGGAIGGFFLLLLVGFIIGFLYFPFFWARGGQTPGMMPFGLRVVSDRDGSRIGWGTALLRLVGLWVAGAVFWLGYIWIFIDTRRRGWQDLIAGTIVVRQP